MRILFLCSAALVTLFVPGSFLIGQASAGNLLQLHDMPPTLPPPEYGNIIMNRQSEKSGQQKVVFPHWSHRANYTCRVCHLEIEFSMEAGDTEITETLIRKGQFCGVCHNGKTAFAPEGPSGKNCKRCHSGTRRVNHQKFTAFSNKLPRARYGNKIDWVRAFRKKLIRPKNSIYGNDTPMTLDRTLQLRAEMALISPALFPHKAHTEWLECSQCHPVIFNIKKKTTKHFSMDKNLDGRFCGVCHLAIAFPMNDCKRCHPRMRQFK